MTENQEAPRRGRPRPLVTLERDEKVAEALQAAGAAQTRRELTERVGLPGNQVYACLHRLRRTDRVRKVNGNTYQLTR
jgi:DNA-binding IclR family transcriptional regulator